MLAPFLAKAEAKANRALLPPEGRGSTLGQLEGSDPNYCKALRILIREGKTLNPIQRTWCWHRLVILHERMPRQYRHPLLHDGMTKRALDADAAGQR